MDDYRTLNCAWWDEAVPLHVKAPFYKVEVFRRGQNVLDPIVRDGVGDVAGKRILHLQCHFGLDTLSLARLGADVTGLDFSPAAIAAAQTLSRETDVRARFIEADVLAPPPDLKEFDIVFASWGALGWIESVPQWMHTAAAALKPGGRLLLFEGHPAAFMIDDKCPANSPLTVRFPYCSADPIVEDVQGTYADRQAILKSPCTVSFAHGLGRILTAAIEAGLTIRTFEEFDRVPWQAFPQLVKADEFYWRLPDAAPFFPLPFALTAERAASEFL